MGQDLWEPCFWSECLYVCLFSVTSGLRLSLVGWIVLFIRLVAGRYPVSLSVADFVRLVAGH